MDFLAPPPLALAMSAKNSSFLRFLVVVYTSYNFPMHLRITQ